MTTCKNQTDKPVPISAPDIKPVNFDMKYIRQQKGHADADKRVSEYHGHKWDASNGAQAKKVVLKSQHSRETANEAIKKWEAAETQLAGTDQYDNVGGGHAS